MLHVTIEDHSSLMIGCNKKALAKDPVGGDSKNKRIRDRVDSEGRHGRWKLRVMAPEHVNKVCLCIGSIYMMKLLFISI